MTVPADTIIDACDDPALFAGWFRNRETWGAWFTFLRALFGLPMTDDDRALFRQCTGRSEPPAGGAREAWLVVGRRGGKSLMLALVAVYLSCFVDWLPYLVPGERGTVMVIATDRRQARTIFRYITALLKVPVLDELIERESADSIDLANGVTIEILTASFRTVRGYTLVAALCDELAFWRNDESANPDAEIIGAIRPAMATVPGSMLLCASSPYARRGALWDAYRRHYGKDGDPVLIWQAPTRTMNPTVPQIVVDEATEADPASASAEYLAQFRVDVETYIAREVVDTVTVHARHELPPMSGASYVAFVDPSGGSSDAFALAIAHRDKDGRAIVDAVRERRPPFSPDAVCQEFAELLKSYGVSTVVGDKYAGEWPRERFRVYGIDYIPADKPKSDIYRDLLPLLNSGRVELLDLPRLAMQLIGLERRTARGGRDSIDHQPGGHDDVANCVAGVVVQAVGAVPSLWTSDALLENGKPAGMPARGEVVFAVAVLGQREAAVCYFAKMLGTLYMVDAVAEPISPQLLDDVVPRLRAFVQATKAPEAFLFAPAGIVQEMGRRGFPAENIDALLREDIEALALAAAVHISAGRVKIIGEVLARRNPLDAGAGEDNPLHLAALIGVALALDQDRSLTARAA